jgi:sterol desaturase/sphingolipid hydroxylase (fatty acid hydroxylase superfamily)
VVKGVSLKQSGDEHEIIAMNPDTALRLLAFLGVLLLMLALERVWPRRREAAPQRRWPAHLGLSLINTGVLFLLPVSAVAASLWAAHAGFGLLPALSLPAPLTFILAWLLLDLAIYAQHRAFHAVPWLWRLHRVHHSDVQLDATTALRFHPVEIGLSMLWKALIVVALGAPLAAVIAYEITLNALALFNHANWRVPGERWLQKLVMTPDLHRIHHSVHREETDSNFSNALICWDQLFATLRTRPRDGHTAMRLGLDPFRSAPDQRLDRLLRQPWEGPDAG